MCGITMHKSSAHYFLERDIETLESHEVIKNRTFGSSDQLLMNSICFVDSEIVLKVILMHVIIVLMYNVCILSTCIQVLGQTTERYGPVTVGCSDTWVASICQIQTWFITRL